MSVILAFNLEQAARVTGLAPQRIRRWSLAGIIAPSIRSGPAGSPYRFLYSFEDLIGLRTLGRLLATRMFSLPQLKLAAQYMRQFYRQPWAQASFLIEGNQLFIKHPNGENVVSLLKPGQARMPLVFSWEQIRQEIEDGVRLLQMRTPEQIGVLERHRNVLHNKWWIAGTRIPTSIIWECAQSGMTEGEILVAYPTIRIEDISAAMAHEEAELARLVSA